MQNQLKRHITLRRKAAAEIRWAQLSMSRDRRTAWAALNQIFRSGAPPNPPLDGRYAGELIAVRILPGVTEIAEWIYASWRPWRGKWFSATEQYGINLLPRRSRTFVHLLAPFYRGGYEDGRESYRAFAFRTYVAPGRVDADREVLKLDYDIPGNPFLTVRRVLDELVQVGENFYLGKAHVKWWWGQWQVVAYFTLSKGANADASRERDATV